MVIILELFFLFDNCSNNFYSLVGRFEKEEWLEFFDGLIIKWSNYGVILILFGF